jgi:hypothetical protein
VAETYGGNKLSVEKDFCVLCQFVREFCVCARACVHSQCIHACIFAVNHASVYE